MPGFRAGKERGQHETVSNELCDLSRARTRDQSPPGKKYQKIGPLCWHFPRCSKRYGMISKIQWKSFWLPCHPALSIERMCCVSHDVFAQAPSYNSISLSPRLDSTFLVPVAHNIGHLSIQHDQAPDVCTPVQSAAIYTFTGLQQPNVFHTRVTYSARSWVTDKRATVNHTCIIITPLIYS